MKKITLFIGLLLVAFQSEAVIQTHAKETLEVQETSVIAGEKSKKEARQTLRKERRKKRKASRAAGNRALTLARLGLGFSVGSIVVGLLILGLAAGYFLTPAMLIGLFVLGSLLALLGFIMAGVSFWQIKKGKLEKKYVWLPILAMTLGLVVTLFWIVIFSVIMLL